MRLGTLQRRLQHDSIIGDINWIPIEVGRGKRYTADERIQNFLQQTALPPAGFLQSSSSVGPLLRVNLHAPSDTPVDVGGSPTTRPPEAAVDATGADGAASGALQLQPCSEYACDHRSSSSCSDSREHQLRPPPPPPTPPPPPQLQSPSPSLPPLPPLVPRLEAEHTAISPPPPAAGCCR